MSDFQMSGETVGGLFPVVHKEHVEMHTVNTVSLSADCDSGKFKLLTSLHPYSSCCGEICAFLGLFIMTNLFQVVSV